MSFTISFAVIAWNQEKYIEEAVEGAFSQSYGPLELVLSDDASEDSSYAVMERMKRHYQGGNTILLNRNANRPGLVGHINRIMEISSGEIVVIAAGDDVSMPDRVGSLIETYRDNPWAHSAHSAALAVNDAGDPITKVSYALEFDMARDGAAGLAELVRKRAFILGATNSWRRTCYDVFGPIDPRIACEDAALFFRACLNGGIKYVDRELIKYRIHENSLSGVLLPPSEREARQTRIDLGICDQCERDVLACGGLAVGEQKLITESWRSRRAHGEMSLDLLGSKMPLLRSVRWMGDSRVGSCAVARQALKAQLPGCFNGWVRVRRAFAGKRRIAY